MQPNSNKEKGFTILEIILALAFTAIMGMVGLLFVLPYRTTQNLRLTMDELTAVIRDTRQKSVTRENGKQWGMRFEETPDGKGRFIVFSGTSFASGTITQTISLRRDIRFGEFCNSPTSSDIVFKPITGEVDSSQYIVLSTGVPQNPVGFVTIDSLGRVYSQLETRILGLWPFDEKIGGTTCDISGNGNTGTLVGTPTWQASCKAGSCLSFGGDSNVLIGPSNILSFHGDFSISFWGKVAATTTRQIAFSISDWDIGDNLDFNFNDNKDPSGIMVFWGGDRVSGKVIAAGNQGQYTDGAWHYIAFTRNGAALSFYADNILVATGTYSGTIGSATNPLMIGRANHSPGHHWKGMIDEVRIYSRALSAEEIEISYDKFK